MEHVLHNAHWALNEGYCAFHSWFVRDCSGEVTRGYRLLYIAYLLCSQPVPDLAPSGFSGYAWTIYFKSALDLTGTIRMRVVLYYWWELPVRVCRIECLRLRFKGQILWVPYHRLQSTTLVVSCVTMKCWACPVWGWVTSKENTPQSLLLQRWASQ